MTTSPTLRTILIGALILTAAPLAQAYNSGKENPGPTDARDGVASGGWMDPSTYGDPTTWATQFEPQEHAGLLMLAMTQAGIPPELQALDTTTVYIDTDQTTISTGFTPVAPAPFSVVGNASTSGVGASVVNSSISRQLSPTSLAGLPDHSFGLWDWVEGNETCPSDVQDPTIPATTNPVYCHWLSYHMGATNSTHFLPQSDSVYHYYHAIALARAAQCGTLMTAFDPGSNALAAMVPTYLMAFQQECAREALAIEAIGQHYLQDAWAIGHQWHRWGSPILSQFPTSVTTANGAIIATDRLSLARLVAMGAGMIHGAEAISRSFGPTPDSIKNILKGDRMNGGAQFILTPSGAVTFGQGDYSASSVVAAGSPDSAQFGQFLNCMVEGLSEVYFQTQGPNATPPSPVADLSPGGQCFGQRATNLSMFQGSGLDIAGLQINQFDTYTLPLEPVIGAITNVVGPLGFPTSGFPPLAAPLLVPEWTRELNALSMELLLAQASSANGTDSATFAAGSIVGNFQLLGVSANDAYNNSALPSPYLDPAFPPDVVKSWPAADTGVENNEIHAREIARFFNRAHIADWCEDPETSVSTLAQMVSNADSQTRGTACQVCTEFAGRHVTLSSGGPSACSLANGSDSDPIDASNDLAGRTPLAALLYEAGKKCGCQTQTVIMAESGDTLSGGTDGTSRTQTIASLDSKMSVNKSGAMAFSATGTAGESVGAVAAVAHSPYPVTFIGGATRNFGGASINDATPAAQAAFRETVSGAPPTYFIRRWNADGSGIETDIGVSGASSNSDYGSASFFQDINDAGVVAFPGLDVNFINQEMLAGNGTPFNSFRNTHGVQTLATLPFPGVLLRPQIASTNDVVYEDAGGNIVVSRYNLSAGSPTPSLVAPASVFSNLSDRPGISADGNWVAFGGTLQGLNPGLFVARATPGGSTPFSGAKGLLFTGTGGDPTNANAMFNSFGVRPSGGNDLARFGIASAGAQLTLIFVASRSYLDPTTHAATKTVYGIYRLQATASGGGDATTYTNLVLQPLLEVGNVIEETQGATVVTRTAADFDLWDPISKDGAYAGFWVQFAETGASGPIQGAVRVQF